MTLHAPSALVCQVSLAASGIVQRMHVVIQAEHNMSDIVMHAVAAVSGGCCQADSSALLVMLCLYATAAHPSGMVQTMAVLHCVAVTASKPTVNTIVLSLWQRRAFCLQLLPNVPSGSRRTVGQQLSGQAAPANQPTHPAAPIRLEPIC